jgi:hypothetical protein
MFYIGQILGVWNGLIQFTLFLIGKSNSKVEQLESRTVSWNGLCSKFEVPLYFCSGNINDYKSTVKQNRGWLIVISLQKVPSF